MPYIGSKYTKVCEQLKIRIPMPTSHCNKSDTLSVLFVIEFSTNINLL